MSAQRVCVIGTGPSGIAAAYPGHFLQYPDFDQIKTPRYTVTVPYHTFRKRLLKELR